MAAGNITLTNQSAAVTGENTAFLSTVKSGDFILSNVGGASYFLAVLTVDSDTGLTLAAPYDGATTSGLAWDLVAKGAYASVPVGLIAESARALRAQNLDKDNWQKVFSVDDDITVTLVDGSQYTGPSWLKVSQVFNAVSLDNILETAKQVSEDASTAAAAASTATEASNTALTAEAAALQSEQNAAVHSGNAATSETNAQNSAVAASGSASSAAASASTAQQVVNSLNPDNLLTKDGNLAGLADLATSRTNLGIGTSDEVTFANANLALTSDTAAVNGGIIRSWLNGSNGTTRAQTQLYTEVRGDNLQYSTISISNGVDTRYLGYNINGILSGVEGANIGNSGLLSYGDVYVNQSRAIGVKTSDGGNKDITLSMLTGDSSSGNWVNLLQGNWYSGYWQIGGVRGGSSNIDHVKVGIMDSGTTWTEFQFRGDYNGHLKVPNGVAGQSPAGSWSNPVNYMGSTFWAATTTGNDGSYVPFVSGGTQSTGGYSTRVSVGAISNGNNAWPDATIVMNGDGTYLRVFRFGVDGNIQTVGDGVAWDGTPYTFQRAATSDRTLKHDIVYTEGKESFDRVMQWLPTMFKFKGQDTQRYGLIAQDLQAIDPQYVTVLKGGTKFEAVEEVDEETGETVTRAKDTGENNPDTLAIDNNVLMVDMACALRYVGGVVEDLQSELAELKALVNQLAGSGSHTEKK